MISDKFRKFLNSTSESRMSLREAKRICERAGYTVTEDDYDVSESANQIVTLPVKGKLNYEILDSIYGQLSDGKWENSPQMGKHWRGVHCDIDSSGTITVELDSARWNYDTDQDYLRWLADKAKAVAKDVEKYEGPDYKWSRTNTTEYDGYFHDGITVRDVYRFYDALKGRIQRIPD